jgi:hypothetical protein
MTRKATMAAELSSTLVLLVLFVGVSPVSAADSRCADGQLAGGLHCGCPDVVAEIAQGLITCPNGFVPVVYDLGKPFPPDPSLTSSLTMEGSVRSKCQGLEKTVGVTGQLVICWGPEDRGCRQMSVPYNSFCIDTENTTLGAGCDASCANVSTNIVALMDAGAAHFHVCPPSANPSAPCRATSNGGDELFRFQPGGFCVTDECDGASSPGPNACVGAWGATYLGFPNRGHDVPSGWYDWASGAFKVNYRGRRPVCGALGACLGNTGHWTGTFVATPSPASPNPPPCLTKAGDTCNPSACAP